MNKSVAFHALIFDLDGLVLDTEPGYCRAWSETLTFMGYSDAQSFCAGLCGLAYTSIVERILQRYGCDFDLELFAHLSQNFWRDQVQTTGIPVKYGFYELIHLLRSYKLPYALATNSRAKNVRECLDLANLRHEFKFILTRDDVEQAKPHPEIYHKALALLNLDAEDCLVLEDSLPGVVAASTAGARVAYVSSSLDDSEASVLANYRFRDLIEVVSFLNRN